MSEIIQAIGRVRRAMPRNADVMLICDELEKILARSSAVEQRPLTPKVVGSNPTAPAKPKFDKRSYQRELMRKRRQKEGKK